MGVHGKCSTIVDLSVRFMLPATDDASFFGGDHAKPTEVRDGGDGGGEGGSERGEEGGRGGGREGRREGGEEGGRGGGREGRGRREGGIAVSHMSALSSLFL